MLSLPYDFVVKIGKVVGAVYDLDGNNGVVSLSGEPSEKVSTVGSQTLIWLASPLITATHSW